MKCVDCGREAADGEQRYGRLWCAQCLQQLDFEERQARARGLSVVDVVKDENGGVLLAFGKDGEVPTRDDLEALTPNREEALEELIEALVAFKRSVVLGPAGQIVHGRARA